MEIMSEIEVHTPAGVILLSGSDNAKNLADKRLPCTGDACNDIDWDFEGRDFNVYNDGSSSVNVRVFWSDILGGCHVSSQGRIRPGAKRTWRIPHTHIGVCRIQANR